MEEQESESPGKLKTVEEAIMEGWDLSCGFKKIPKAQKSTGKGVSFQFGKSAEAHARSETGKAMVCFTLSDA